MKVLLISFSRRRGFSGYGVRTLSACLRKANHQTGIVFVKNDRDDDLQESVFNYIYKVAEEYPVIGFSLMTDNFYDAMKVSLYLRRKFPEKLLVWGGIHPTVCPEESLAHCDMVCIGEGEETIVGLVDSIESGQDWRQVPGLAFIENGTFRKSKKQELVIDLDSLPFQDYSCENHYVVSNELSEEISSYNLKDHLWISGAYETLATRGCPFGCTYCINNLWNKMYPLQKTIRKRSIDNLIEELVAVRRKLPFIKSICMNDDAFFMYSVDEIRKFSRLYKEKIGCPLFVTGISPSSLRKDKLGYLLEAGLNEVRMGIQSGSGTIRKSYKRNHSEKAILKAAGIFNYFVKKKMLDMVNYDIILDNPWETEDEVVETLIFLSKLPAPFGLNLYSLTFYPGTEVFDRAVKDGLIQSPGKDYYRSLNFFTFKKSYTNSLVYLVHFFAINQPLSISINEKMMRLLTNKTCRSLGVSFLFYNVLRFLRQVHKVFKPKGYYEVAASAQLNFGFLSARKYFDRVRQLGRLS